MNRVKLYLASAVLLCMGAACTKDASGGGQERIPVLFDAVSRTATKLPVYGEMPPAYNTAEKFVVYAAYSADRYSGAASATEFIPGETCTYSGSLDAWAPAHIYYWPRAGYLTFEAFSPAELAGVSHSWSGGFGVSGFEATADASKQVDILYSSREYDKHRSDYSSSVPYDDDDDSRYVYNGVNIEFRHALCAVVLRGRTRADYTSVEVILKSVELTGVDSTGDFYEGVTDAPKAGFGMAPHWDNTYTASTEKSYPILSSDKKLSYNSGEPEKIGPVLLLIPQDLIHASTTTKVSLRLTYTVAQNGGPALEQTSVVPLSGLMSAGVPITQWECGKKYIYNLIFGLDSVYFDPLVADWTLLTSEFTL